MFALAAVPCGAGATMEEPPWVPRASDVQRHPRRSFLPSVRVEARLARPRFFLRAWLERNIALGARLLRGHVTIHLSDPEAEKEAVLPRTVKRNRGTADEMRKTREGIERTKELLHSTRQRTSNNAAIWEEEGGRG